MKIKWEICPGMHEDEGQLLHGGDFEELWNVELNAQAWWGAQPAGE